MRRRDGDDSGAQRDDDDDDVDVDGYWSVSCGSRRACRSARLRKGPSERGACEELGFH